MTGEEKPTPWLERAKEAARSRDNQRCVLCDSAESLHCHHVDGNRQNNNLWNVITLCSSCHYSIHNPTNRSQLFRASEYVKYLQEQFYHPDAELILDLVYLGGFIDHKVVTDIAELDRAINNSLGVEEYEPVEIPKSLIELEGFGETSVVLNKPTEGSNCPVPIATMNPSKDFLNARCDRGGDSLCDCVMLNEDYCPARECTKYWCEEFDFRYCSMNENEFAIVSEMLPYIIERGHVNCRKPRGIEDQASLTEFT